MLIFSAGNCLFRAVSAQLFGGTEDRHQKVRKAVVNAAEAGSALYIHFNAENDVVRRTERRPSWGHTGRDRSDPVDEAASFRQRLAKMRRDGEYGAEIEIRVIADLYSARISVYSTRPDTPVAKYNAELPAGRPHIYLLHDHTAEHYWSLRRIDTVWPIEGRKADALIRERAVRRPVADERGDASQKAIRKRSASESADQNDKKSLPRKKLKDLSGRAVAPTAVDDKKVSSAETSPNLDNSHLSTPKSTPATSVSGESTSDISISNLIPSQLGPRQPPARNGLPKPAEVRVDAVVKAREEDAEAARQKALSDAIWSDDPTPRKQLLMPVKIKGVARVKPKGDAAKTKALADAIFAEDPAPRMQLAMPSKVKGVARIKGREDQRQPQGRQRVHKPAKVRVDPGVRAKEEEEAEAKRKALCAALFPE